MIGLLAKVPIGLKFVQCAGSFGNANRSSGAEIQTVDRLPKLVMAFDHLLHLPQGKEQCIRSFSMRGHASRFQHDKMVVIFEENVELHGQREGKRRESVDKLSENKDKLLN